MYGEPQTNRASARLEREERLVQFITEGRSVSVVAVLEGLEHDYAYKLLMKVAKDKGLVYQARRTHNPGAMPVVGLTTASQPLRARLGDHLYKLQGKPPEIARATGVSVKGQRYARDRPFNYDWSLSQIERLAEASGMSFRALMLAALLAPEEYEKVKAAA